MTRKRAYCLYVTLTAGRDRQMVIARLPEGGVRWKVIVRGLGRIAKVHGGNASAISALDGLCDTKDGPSARWGDQERAENAEFLKKVEREFAGDGTLFGPFELWVWDDTAQEFKLTRTAETVKA